MASSAILMPSHALFQCKDVNWTGQPLPKLPFHDDSIIGSPVKHIFSSRNYSGPPIEIMDVFVYAIAGHAKTACDNYFPDVMFDSVRNSLLLNKHRLPRFATTNMYWTSEIDIWVASSCVFIVL